MDEEPTKFEKLARAAREQDHVVTRKQFVAFEFSDFQVGLMIKKEHWTHLQRGVVLLGPGPATRRQLARAAQWAGGKSLALDGLDALLWAGLSLDAPAEDAPIELVATRRTAGSTPVGAVVRHPSRVIRTRRQDGVIVVCIEDALLGYAATNPSRKELEYAVEMALLTRRTTERRIRQTVGRNSRPGVRGVALLRRVMESRPNGKPARSMLELEVLDLIRAHKLLLPSRNVDVVDGDGKRREIDLCYVDRKGAIECNGKRWHSTATQTASDARRRRALEAVGFEFVVVTWADVFERPEWVLAEVRRLLVGVVAA